MSTKYLLWQENLEKNEVKSRTGVLTHQEMRIISRVHTVILQSTILTGNIKTEKRTRSQITFMVPQHQELVWHHGRCHFLRTYREGRLILRNQYIYTIFLKNLFLKIYLKNTHIHTCIHIYIF